jgi:hypothetical protein
MSQDTDGKTELQILKDRARLMGIGFSNNISVEALKGKINAKLEGEQADAEEAEAQDAADEEAGLFAAPAETPAALQTTVEAAPAADGVVKISDLVAAAATKGPEAAAPVVPTHTPQGRKLTKQELFNATREQLIRDETKLIRVRITNMDPKKKDLHGEIFTVGNKFIGTIKKFVPYGEATDGGYHLPKILVDELRARQFQDIRTTKDKRTGVPTVTSRWVREFSIEVLPPLTQEELTNLAISQAAAGSVDAAA